MAKYAKNDRRRRESQKALNQRIDKGLVRQDKPG